MADGQHVMNQSLAAVVEHAIGSPLPGMDVRFRALTVRAKFTIYPPSFGRSIQVPTLLSPLKKGVQRLLSRQHVVHKDILKDVTGVFLPGRVTLVLGLPGSGKSTLMKVLSGRFPISKQIDFTGEVAYNDMKREHILDRIARYVSYADATDEHYGRMTVEETFNFASACCAGQELAPWVVNALTTNANDQHALDVLAAHHRHAAEIVAKKLGLESVKHAFVGDQEVSGLTPSQKKRVTIGEMAFGLKAVHIVDEISSGLDATTKFDIVDSLHSLAVNLNRTVVVAMSQPTPEVLELVDDLLVLTDGHLIYHGPRAHALRHFRDLGLECPPRKDVADFLLELGTPKQRAYKNSRTDLVPLTPAEFATCFQQSTIYQSTLRYLATPHDARPPTSNLSVPQVPKFRQGFVQDLGLLLRRQLLLSARNKAFLIGRSFMVLLMGALYGTTFWQLQDTSSQLVLGLLFSCSMFLSLGQAAQLATFLGNRAVFYKQRGANFFRTSSYVIASCIAQLPFALFETVLFGSFLYWMGGYVSLADRFATFLLTLFLCQMCFTAFFFLVASATPHASAAQGITVVSILLFTLFSGFLVTRTNIPDYLVWIYWLDPIAWCIRALSVNQYTAPQYMVCVYKGVDYCTAFGGKTMAQYSLATFDLDDDTIWIYYTWLVFGASYAVFSFLSYVLLEFKRFETPEDTLAVSVDFKSVMRQLKRQQAREDGRERGTTAYSKMDDDAMDGYMLHSQTPSTTSEGGGGMTISEGRGGVPVVESEPDLLLAIPQEGRSGFVPVTLAFQDLWFSVPVAGREEEVDLLKNVSGFALPGTMTALLGDQGAGKTTLLDVIAGRKSTGKIRGDLFLNGYPATDLALRRCAGYCDHVDIHADSATFREAMQFAAMLRQDAAISKIEKFVHVEECIDMLELRPIADRIIRGATKEQFKRLSIGVELAASPSLLFVDDPTRGLDARAAVVIMTGLRKVADTGRTVVCTLTQPTNDVFNLFDSALVLQRGGTLAFFGQIGEDAERIIEYFNGVPGVAPLKPGYNPATWVLDTINVKPVPGTRQRPTLHRRHSIEDLPIDFAMQFQLSDQLSVLEEDLDQDGLTRPSSYLPEIKFETKRAAGSLRQLWMLSKRSLRMHWRTPTYNLARLMLSAILAGLFGIMYHGTKYETFRGANAGVGMIFLSTIFFGLIAFNAALPIAAAERAVFYREREAQTYNTLWSFTASTVSEIPFVLLSGFLFTAILFPLVGFEGQADFVFYWLVTSLHLLMQVYMAQWFVYILPSVKGASALGALLSSVFLLFAGFNPPTYKIPSVYKFLYYLSPPSYTISALAAKVFADCSEGTELGCKVLLNAPGRFNGATLKVYMESVYSMKHDTMWRNVAIIYALTICFRAFGLLALRFVNYRKK